MPCFIAGCGNKEPDVVGQWNGAFSADATKEMGGHAPTVSLKLAADHTFQLQVGVLTTGHWDLASDGVHLKAEQRAGQPISPGGDGQEITLKLSEDGKTMASPTQPITYTKA
ncbi:MAG TPA: hypothetical protein VG820_08740 [Fimbriimonadaceae bacterium]|nr:hypothetical protein [Fimbriimonadaceae bacterium]